MLHDRLIVVVIVVIIVIYLLFRVVVVARVSMYRMAQIVRPLFDCLHHFCMNLHV